LTGRKPVSPHRPDPADARFPGTTLSTDGPSGLDRRGRLRLYVADGPDSTFGHAGDGWGGTLDWLTPQGWERPADLPPPDPSPDLEALAGQARSGGEATWTGSSPTFANLHDSPEGVRI
jgi:hypothetical protein